MNSEPSVLADDDGPIRVLTLNRPGRLNAFTADSYLLLAELLHEAATDAEVSVIVLRGAGRAFSSGVDFASLGEGNRLAETFDRLLDELIDLPKPLIAAVQGPAVGFGATVLLHCDVVMLADDARLRYPFTALPTAPEAGSSVLLPEAVGPQVAAELLFTARWVDAPEAVELGLARRMFPADRLHAETMQVAHAMAAQPPAAVAAAKRLLRAARKDNVRAALELERQEAGIIRAAAGPMTFDRSQQTSGGT